MRKRVVFPVVLVLVSSVAWSQQRAPVSLTLKQAVELGLKNNLGVLTAKTAVDEAAGVRLRQLAILLPHASADTLVNRQNRNLAVAGLSIPGIPTVIPAFSFVDFRIAATQPLVDAQALHEWRASVKAEMGASLAYADLRDLVVRETAGLYLAAQAAAAEVDAARARMATSTTLEQLARDQRDQGLATGIDVVRAQVQLSRDRQNALVATNIHQTSLLTLARFIGLDLGQTLTLAETLSFEREAAPAIADGVARALSTRADYRALAAQREAVAEQRRATAARTLPKLTLSGDYGALGRTSGSLPGIGEVQATLSMSLFDRDRAGERLEIESRLHRIDEQIADLARGIEQELRQAVLDLQSADERVEVATAAVDLAERELALAEDRFRNGVSDNIEVVRAQDSVAATRDERIAALARHADARLALRRALGVSEAAFVSEVKP